MEQPCLWEGLFRIACLTKNKPMDEPVTALILNGIGDSGSGALEGSVREQICRARAAFAVYEYCTDKKLLQRIALWFRYIEIEFDTLCLQDQLLYRPADLMELLVRFYQVTGTKAVLRLCSRLRAESFDWTTALHTFQQSIPVLHGKPSGVSLRLSEKPQDMDYDEKQKLINHAELLADGVRYTLYAGLFSGHGQDLSSGRTAWQYLSRHHRTVCGGTTADPFLCGCGPDMPVGTAAAAAWTEAFAAQMIQADTEWALDELIRIVFNSLDDCLEQEELPEKQYVNTLRDTEQEPADPAALYARITRAADAAVRHSVTISEGGIRINYLLPVRFLLMIRKQPVILQMTEDSACFHCNKPFFSPVDFYASGTADNRIMMSRDGKTVNRNRKKTDPARGFYLHTEGEWKDRHGFRTEKTGHLICEETHHRGACYLYENRLLSIPADTGRFAFSAGEAPEVSEEGITICLSETDAWKAKDGIPNDIPVLPEAGKERYTFTMSPYSGTRSRITMFPRTGAACLK